MLSGNGVARANRLSILATTYPAPGSWLPLSKAFPAGTYSAFSYKATRREVRVARGHPAGGRRESCAFSKVPMQQCHLLDKGLIMTLIASSKVWRCTMNELHDWLSRQHHGLCTFQ